MLSRSEIAFHHQTAKDVQINHVSRTPLDNKDGSYLGFLTSQNICILMCSSPLVVFIFLSLLHNLMLTFEQVMIKIQNFKCNYLNHHTVQKMKLSNIVLISVPEKDFAVSLHGVSFKSGLHSNYG